MLKNYIISAAIMCFHLFAFGGEMKYDVSSIPEALLQNANAVKRTEEIRFEVLSISKAKRYERYAVTVLNENGDKFASAYEVYDKLRSVESITGHLYDSKGNKIKSLKKNEIKDFSNVSDNNLIDDSRIKFHSFYYKTYPYTVEYEVEVSYNNTYMFPVWLPQYTENISVESSNIIIACPQDFSFRYKATNYAGEPKITTVKGKKEFLWEVKSLPALLKEYASPNWLHITTNVFFSPDKFQIDDYKGDFSSWQSYGNFILQLNKGKDVLPAHIKQKVHEIADPLPDDKAKVKALYEYMQKNTRYISIQLGIGGLQPFDATYVATKSYGDCKALSNYMYSLLKEAGIKSCYTLIRAGRGERFFIPDFPSDPFNHIILSVPVKKDTIWLECTNQTLPAGYLSEFTSNRYALAIDENGGKLVKTPRYGLQENLQKRIVKSKLQEDGTLLLDASSRYEAEQQDEVYSMINYLTKDKVKEYLHNHFDFGTYDIASFDYKQNKRVLPYVDEQLNISVSNYATITGKRLFIVPNVMTRHRQRLKQDNDRKYEVSLDFAYRDIDSIEIEIPDGYTLESKLKDQAITSRFGKYSSKTTIAGNKLYYYRSMEQYSGTFPASAYNELVEFYNAIYKSDRSKVVFVKKE